MKRFLTGYCRLLDGLMGLALLLMVVLVFGNVVLRYVFNSGVTESEEISRWLFVWLTFLGAVVALQHNDHLGTDMLVSRLPTAGKKACLILGHVLMLYICWLLLRGAWQQAEINWDAQAPVTGLSLAIFYGSGVFFAISAGVILLHKLFQVLSGQLQAHELVMVKESEEQAELEALQAELARQAAPRPHPAARGQEA